MYDQIVLVTHIFTQVANLVKIHQLEPSAMAVASARHGVHGQDVDYTRHGVRFLGDMSRVVQPKVRQDHLQRVSGSLRHRICNLRESVIPGADYAAMVEKCASKGIKVGQKRARARS